MPGTSGNHSLATVSLFLIGGRSNPCREIRCLQRRTSLCGGLIKLRPPRPVRDRNKDRWRTPGPVTVTRQPNLRCMTLDRNHCHNMDISNGVSSPTHHRLRRRSPSWTQTALPCSLLATGRTVPRLCLCATRAAVIRVQTTSRIVRTCANPPEIPETGIWIPLLRLEGSVIISAGGMVGAMENHRGDLLPLPADPARPIKTKTTADLIRLRPCPMMYLWAPEAEAEASAGHNSPNRRTAGSRTKATGDPPRNEPIRPGCRGTTTATELVLVLPCRLLRPPLRQPLSHPIWLLLISTDRARSWTRNRTPPVRHWRRLLQQRRHPCVLVMARLALLCRRRLPTQLELRRSSRMPISSNSRKSRRRCRIDHRCKPDSCRVIHPAASRPTQPLTLSQPDPLTEGPDLEVSHRE